MAKVSTLSAILILLPSSFSCLKIVAVLPLQHVSVPTSSWERGLEILPGAQVAIEHINQDQQILPRHQLELVPIDSGTCEKENLKESLINFINQTLYHELDLIGVIGLSCLSSEHLIAEVAVRISKQLTVISSSNSASSTCSHQACTSTYHMLQSKTILLDTLIDLTIHLGWTKIAIVTDSTQQHVSVAEHLYQSMAVNNIIKFIQLHENQHLMYPFQELRRFNLKIIFLSTNITKTISILCTAKEQGFTWPEYAWIIHSITFADFVASEHISTCNIHNALEGIILLEHRLKTAAANDEFQILGYTYSDYFKKYTELLSNLSREINIQLRPNIYANLLHDSVWVYTLALHSKLNNSHLHLSDHIRNTDLDGTIGHISFHHNSETRTGVNILQIRNGSTVYIGHYNPNWKNITFTDSSFNTPLPSDGHSVISDNAPLSYSTFLSLLVVICTVLVTLTLVLYIYYHREPEIKSTSVTLSLLMFIGCYMILIYLFLAILYTQSLVPSTSPFNICTALVWLNLIGIPMPLILATLLIKMLRVYRIFTFYRKIGRMCSDVALLIYVLLLISPCVLILIFWSTADTYTAKDIAMEYPHFTRVEQRCFSKHLLVWIGMLLLNITVLIVAIIIVAVKTRKIRQAHFKDTKKVNIFLFILLSMIIVAVSYWMLLRTIGTNKGHSDIILHIANIIIVASCQGFLFAPKILPPLQRSVSKRYKLKNYVPNSSSKTHSTTITSTNNQQTVERENNF